MLTRQLEEQNNAMKQVTPHFLFSYVYTLVLYKLGGQSLHQPYLTHALSNLTLTPLLSQCICVTARSEAGWLPEDSGGTGRGNVTITANHP